MPKKTGVLTTLDDNGNIVEMYPEVITDTTLSVSGKPADAAAVGEALTNIQPGDNSVILTQAEYDALSDKEKDSDTTYYISDRYAQPNAFSIPFTSNKYNATTTGDALNEVKTELEETNSNLSNLYHDGTTIMVVANNELLDYTATSDGTLIVTTNNSSIGFGILQFPNVGKSIGFANTISINIKKGTRVTTSGIIHIAYFIS